MVMYNNYRRNVRGLVGVGLGATLGSAVLGGFGAGNVVAQNAGQGLANATSFIPLAGTLVGVGFLAETGQRVVRSVSGKRNSRRYW